MEDKTLNDVLIRLTNLEKNYEKLSKKLGNDEIPEPANKNTYKFIIEEWNNELSGIGIPKITSISGRRLKLVQARIREYGKESFHTCIEEVKHSSFLQGRTKKSWTGFSFDWMVLPSNFPKVLEGNYNDSRRREEDMVGSSSIPESWGK